jgi:hypothetical protein
MQANISKASEDADMSETLYYKKLWRKLTTPIIFKYFNPEEEL